jgi:hypothetical protein
MELLVKDYMQASTQTRHKDAITFTFLSREEYEINALIPTPQSIRK